MSKSYRIGLDANQVQTVIDDVRRYREGVIRASQQLVSQLVSDGVTVGKAIAAAMDPLPYETGSLLSHGIRGMYNQSTNIGWVYTDPGVWWAVYVEMGTGIVGERSQGDTLATHPNIPWEYDVNSHGDAGWWYVAYDQTDVNTGETIKGGLRWTKGMPPRPFMYLTGREIWDQRVKTARTVFRSI